MIFTINTYQPFSFPVALSQPTSVYPSPATHHPFHLFYPLQSHIPPSTHQPLPHSSSSSSSDDDSDHNNKHFIHPLQPHRSHQRAHARPWIHPHPALEYRQPHTNPIERELDLLRNQVRSLEEQLYALKKKFKQVSRTRHHQKQLLSPAHSPIILEFTRKLPPKTNANLPSTSRASATDDHTSTMTSAKMNPNFNQSNNNDVELEEDNKDESEDDGDDAECVEKILDAFERSFLSQLESSQQPMKVKYIPKDRSATWPHRRRTLNPIFT